ncbi:hypothetical protein PENTCL1PPCAC_13252, partial [Pristionchus entomophagus]
PVWKDRRWNWIDCVNWDCWLQLDRPPTHTHSDKSVSRVPSPFSCPISASVAVIMQHSQSGLTANPSIDLSIIPFFFDLPTDIVR